MFKYLFTPESSITLVVKEMADKGGEWKYHSKDSRIFVKGIWSHPATGKIPFFCAGGICVVRFLVEFFLLCLVDDNGCYVGTGFASPMEVL